MIDQTDLEIIRELRGNARSQHREIGERVHLTGQAVSNRIAKLERDGIILGYTAVIDEGKLGNPIFAIVTVYMKTMDHQGFLRYARGNDCVTEAHRVSGEGCYILTLRLPNQEVLNTFLDGLLEYGNYRVNLSIGKVK